MPYGVVPDPIITINNYKQTRPIQTERKMNVQLRRVLVLAIVFVLVVLFFFSRRGGHPLIGRAALDPEVIAVLRDKLLQPPSQLPYDLLYPETRDVSIGQSQLVLEVLGNKTGGTFIECGALDGETRSNTLYMERFLGWRGLLIEADPSNFQLLLKKHRQAWAIHACLSGDTVSEVRFKHDFNMGMIDDGRPSHRADMKTEYSDVLCLPLESMLKALQWTTIDYFSLDVEGHEYAVLAALPFDRLNIRTLSVEFRHVPEGKAAIRRLMESNGYQVYTVITHHDDLANDFIFKRRT